MICSKCGQQVPDNVAFCRNCGTPTGVNAAAATNAAVQAAQQAQQQAQQPGIVRDGDDVGVPKAGLSGKVLDFMGPDRVKSAKLLWRIAAGVGAFFVLLHTFGLWFGTAIKYDIDSDFIPSKAKRFSYYCKSEVFENSGITIFIMLVLILLTLAAIGCLALAITKFLAVDASETFKFISFSFAGVAVGKIFLFIWNLAIRDDMGEGASDYIIIPFALIFSLLVCIAFAALFWILNSEFYRYREPVAARPAGLPFGQAPQQPYAPQAPQQPYAPQAPQQPYAPQAPQQPPQNPQNPYQQ